VSNGIPTPNCKTGAGIEPRGSLLLIPLGAFTVVEISGYKPSFGIVINKFSCLLSPAIVGKLSTSVVI